MTATVTKSDLDLNQGKDAQGRTFGYVHGDDGGFFFTWMPTLDETINSVEVDEVDGDGDLSESEVVEFLASHLPTTKRGREMWGQGDAE
jgi:hypothetical protein